MKKLIPDIRDVLIFGGLLSLGIGLWWYAPWISLTVMGVILITFGVLGSLRQTK